MKELIVYISEHVESDTETKFVSRNRSNFRLLDDLRKFIESYNNADEDNFVIYTDSDFVIREINICVIRHNFDLEGLKLDPTNVKVIDTMNGNKKSKSDKFGFCAEIFDDMINKQNEEECRVFEEAISK